ncbi:MAG: VWA domain-containing protein [Deltaproteobacteria bacterium]|nr:VWA domain-containing protein [Deltaproteobacteria bacterium]
MLAAAGVHGCSAGAGPPGAAPSGAGGFGSGSGGAAGSSSSGGAGGSGGELLDAGVGDGPDPDAACALLTHDAKALPLSLYVMLDKSASMSGNKWEAAKAGLKAFVEDPASAGLRVALKFFPRPPDAVPACDQQAYAVPSVPFGELPDHAPAIESGIEAETPNGLSTPTYPALGGAILKGIELAKNNPGETSAVLLVTDGKPQGPAPTCGGVDPEDTQVIAALAAKGAGYAPPVYTFVIGLPGVDHDFADTVAAAGGSGSAVLVDADNVLQGFQDALTEVRVKALPCEYEIPELVAGGEVAYDHVNVLLTLGGGAPQIVPQTEDCGGKGGWYYDDPVQPTKLLLCPATCQLAKGDTEAKIQILLGCKTERIK